MFRFFSPGQAGVPRGGRGVPRPGGGRHRGGRGGVLPDPSCQHNPHASAQAGGLTHCIGLNPAF